MSQNLGECQEMSGFLFPHACNEMADGNCSKCQKSICDQHTVRFETGKLCVACAKVHFKDPLTGEYRKHRHEPYFYTSYYYSDYWDSYDDFTDSDEVSVRGGEASLQDTEGFEDDMGAS